MKLLILRHGEAEEPAIGVEDSVRSLTKQGREKMALAAKGIKVLADDIDCILSSPLVRAQETAAIVARQYQLDPERCEALAPGQPLTKLLYRLSACAKGSTVLLVGHEPDLTALIASLLGAGAASIELKKGACCGIEFAGGVEPGKGRLLYLLRNRHLRGIAV